MLTEDGPRTDVADVSSYSHYPIAPGDPKSGMLHQLIDAAGLATTYTSYDPNGRPLTMTDANGVVTTFTYSPRGWLESQERAGETTTYDYFKTGLIKQVTQASGAFLRFSYNEAHQLTAMEDAAGNKVAYSLDAAGNILREDHFDPLGQLAQTRSQVFDARGRLHQTVGATSGQRTTFGYDHNDNLLSVTDPLYFQTRYEYDALNRQVRIYDPGNQETQFRYDSLDQLVKVIDPRGLETRYGLDGLGNNLDLESPDTGNTASTFDTAGNLKTRIDAKGQAAAYSHDTLNRLTLVSYTGGPSISYRYDEGTYGKGRLTGMSDASGTTSWTYDAQGRLLGKTQEHGALELQTLHVYDPAGQPSQLILPSGHVIAYQWTDGELRGMSMDGQPLLSQITHHPFGGPNGWIFGNGETVKRDHDLDGRVVRVSMGDLPLPTGARDYRYDANNRLTQYSGPGGATIDYEYDANGNRTRQSTATDTVDYAIDPDSNRIASTQVNGGPAQVPAYDANGSTTQESLNSYTYDAAGRLTSANGPSYLYNGQGQRTVKTVNGTTTHFVYDDQGQLIGEYDALGNPIQETVWLGNLPVAVIKPGQGAAEVYYVHADHLGTPRSIDDSQGQSVWVWDTITFGASQPDEDPRNTGTDFVYNLRFPGQYHDQEAGLNQNWHRNYNPATGRYVQSDPIGIQGGTNTYIYTLQNPLKNIDPQGLEVAAPFPWPRSVPPVATSASATGLGAACAAILIGALAPVNATSVCADLPPPPDSDCPTPCPPCKTISGKLVPVGTIGYRPLDVIPDDVVQHGVAGSHHNIFVANQNPNNCRCFWAKQKYVLKPGQIPLGAIPVEPFLQP